MARLIAQRFAVSAARIRKYAANTRFANARCLESGFKPRPDLQDALAATIRRAFGGQVASDRKWALLAKAEERHVT
ncbi:MAG: hypothetical protein ACREJ5_14215 [Geminicoccaceae bacterium]